MKTSMDVRYLVLLFFFVSCMPQSQVSKDKLASTDGGTTDPTGANTTQVPSSVTSWNYLAVNTNSITINVSNLNNAYVVGSAVEKYLNTLSGATLINFTNAEYCVVSDFGLAGLKYQLRSRTVPIAYYDFANKKIVRSFRVDFDDVTNSAATCAASLKIPDPNGNYTIDTTVPATWVYDPKNLCPGCTTTLTSTAVRIFKKSAGSLLEVSRNSLNLGSLLLSIDPNYNATGGAGTCTNTQCKARGFDCCLDNQCVTDGSNRPSATSLYYSQWQSAEQERLTNPLAYVNYPHIYYVCGSTVPSDPSAGTGPVVNPPVDYVAGFEQLKKDYKCIEHIKAQSTITPFHDEILSRATPYTPGTDCLTSGSDVGQPMYYLEVIKRLYKTCGCSKTSLSDMVSSCPAYDYTVVLKDNAGEPTRIDCYTPPSQVHVPSVQQVNLNSRSAPHRFFESITGLEKNILGTERSYTVSGVITDYVQEGDSFHYMDEGKILPVQQDFSMNAILGPMTVNLSNALPARAVDVEMDQVYIVSTVSGYFTPCPICAKDSWISSFTAFPGSSMGTGLQAVGHTTQRDALSTNYTAGNYEDTIFGRACWVPPTMLPFSHSEMTTVQEQRLNRLKTQAALFANGYQRDWFGFNKGALIGSFDGVSWFAVGKGRIVKSSSRKLFLAINAPFADLSSPTQHVVQVQAYDGITKVADVDYDPQYASNHPYQNEAGSCQANHLCETDADCITRLGWEYACNDVKDIKTQWPVFDINAKEQLGENVVTLDQILQQKKFPNTGGTKRCIYRGAGAPCIKASRSITDITTRKNLTCAPNFHCAGVSGGNQFNSKVSRYAANLSDIPVVRNHLYGRDANVLGRPLNYIHYNDGSSLHSSITGTLVENLSQYEALSNTELGLCRPGKNLTSTDPYEQHRAPDNQKRADFINQIGSCDAGNFSTNRYTTCPSLTAEGNYEIFDVENTLFSGWSTGIVADYNKRTRAQNACGLDSIKSGTDLTSSLDVLTAASPFVSIEAKPLSAATVLEPTFARDACFRRAGAVCHTDLDCSPNKYHADQVDYYPLSHFGNSLPEQNYYKEYLVCGQGDPQPSPSDSVAFKTYNMSKNVCCREVGKDLTTFTADIPSGTATGSLDSVTAGLITLDPPGLKPNQDKRYSRLATVDDLAVAGERPVLSANHARYTAGFPTGLLYGGLSRPNQWKTLNEANSETCCGGGWMRKFSDNSTDWTKRNRLVIDPTNFKCVNSKTVLTTNPEILWSQYGTTPFASQAAGAADVMALISRDFYHYCMDSALVKGGCSQYGIQSTPNVVAPALDHYANAGEITINTIAPTFTNPASLPFNDDFYFVPESGDSDPATTIDYGDTTTVGARRNITIKIPSFVARKGFDDSLATLGVKMVSADLSVNHTCRYDNSALPQPNPSLGDTGANCDGTVAGGRCCYTYDPATRLLQVVGEDVADGAQQWITQQKKVGIEFTVGAPGGQLAGDATRLLTRMSPGSDTYYLKRLGTLELSGIPQIKIQPLYCSDDSDRLVPGIFKPSMTRRSDFEQISNSFHLTVATSDEKYTTHHALEAEPIFAANEFKCCSPLGKIVNNADKCCSGYGRPFGNGTSLVCNLPPGTNLMVYFNRFVSNEGTDKDGPGGGLIESDFDASTGETLLASNVIDKLRALGNAYCDSSAQVKTRTGALFGNFEAEPVGPSTSIQRVYSMTDSTRDFQKGSANSGDLGYIPFGEGFRWNHHLYCNE